MKKNLIIRILVTLLILLIILFILIFAYNKLSDNPEITSSPIPETTEAVSKPNVDVLSYKVYNFSDLDFNFVLAKIRVKNTSTTDDLNLSNYITNEGLVLTDIETYKQKLEDNGYYLGKQSVIYQLSKQDETYFTTIFIPCDKESKDLSVTNEITNNALNFNLENSDGTAESLYYDLNDIITDGVNYQMTISSAKQIEADIFTRTLSDGTILENPVPSTAEVYAFDVVATSLQSEVVTIESATYIVDDSNLEFDALDMQYQTPLYTNIIGQFITDDSTGSIFIMTLNPNQEKITYHGTLKLQISNVNDPVSIKVDID